MKQYNDEEYIQCKLDELQFEELTEEDKNVLQTHLRRGPFHWIFGIATVMLGVNLLVWAWLLSHNGIGYGVAATILSLILFFAAWNMFLHKPKTNAIGVIHGEIEEYRYQASRFYDSMRAAEYYADITFDSSKQRVSNILVPEGFRNKGKSLPKENHFPQKGAEIIIYKYDKKYPYTFVYPEASKYTDKLNIKG